MDFKKFLPHLIALGMALLMVFAYNYPVLQGETIQQHDIVSSRSAAKEIWDYRAAEDEEPLWTNSQFGGMPAFGISTEYPNNWVNKLERVTKRGFPSQVGLLIALILGFYFLLITLGVDWRLALIGGLAFGFSSYFLISYAAGHTGKLRTIGYMAPLLAGVLLVYRGRWLLGGGLAALFAGLSLNANHPQITYYLVLMLGIVGISELVRAIKSRNFKTFGIGTVVLVIAAVIGLGPNVSKIWSVYDYSKETIRGGKSELAAKADATDSGGLDIDYAFGWSYGKAETLTLLVPDMMGRASGAGLSKTSNTYEELVARGVPRKQAEKAIASLPLYWGSQPFTSGPVYIGAIICFLFVLGLLIVDARHRWWILAATVVAIILAWGKNFLLINEPMFDFFPLYNKFRAPSMILTVGALCMPLLGFLALDKILKNPNYKTMWPKVLIALGVTGGLAALIALLGPTFASFEGASDARYEQSGFPIGAIMDDRAAMMRSSAFKSLLLILAASGLIWAFLKQKASTTVLIVGIGVLVMGDLWVEGRHYLNKDNFVSERTYDKNFAPNQLDLQIQQDPDLYYRVWSLAQAGNPNPWNDALTSAQHKHLGGYSAVKLIRIQDLWENQIQKGNPRILNMFNVKYVMTNSEQGARAQPNPAALGNAWFVEQLQWVPDADAEMAALTEFEPSTTALVDERFRDYSSADAYSISGSTIELTAYHPNRLSYSASVKGGNQFVVFSEMYYEGSHNDWKVSVDGAAAEHIRVNYALRGMELPEGEHTIEFSFEPKSYFMGETVSLIGSLLLLLFVVLAIVMDAKGKGRLSTESTSEEEAS